jgi:hypothetical protein
MDTTEVRSQVRSRAEKMKTSQPQRDMNSGQLFKTIMANLEREFQNLSSRKLK